ncbi:MAG: hypothetical protein K8T10_10090 [Candidatus Eremiobacteraeota bacterium]|nr:hypothetical protein [Candidatus Eremiobacteraeota bacterium]
MYDKKIKPISIKRSGKSTPGRKGALLVELIIACVIITVAILTLLSTFSLVSTLSAKTRNQIHADLMIKSILDRIRAHRYGNPEPYNWNGTETIKIIPEMPISKVQAEPRVSIFTFTQKVDYENKSFIGKANKDYDTVTITISWAESTPGKQDVGKGKREESSRIQTVMEVRRSVPDQYELEKK